MLKNKLNLSGIEVKSSYTRNMYSEKFTFGLKLWIYLNFSKRKEKITQITLFDGVEVAENDDEDEDNADHANGNDEK